MQLPRISMQRILVASLLAAQVCADSITLTQFQQIAGFPSACTEVYDTPVNGCTSNDFQSGGSCSQACASGLQEISNQLNTACAGIPTSSTTLIGLFLRSKGVATLCPKIAPVSTAAAATTVPAPSSVAPSSTSSPIEESTSSQTPISSTLSSAVSAATSLSTQTSSSTTTVQSSTSITSITSSTVTATPGNNNFGGDVGNLNGPSNAASNLKLNVLSISLVVAGLTIGMLV